MNDSGQYGANGSYQYPPPPPPYYFPNDYVTPEEKKKIRKNYNGIGITLLALYFLILISCTVGYTVYDPHNVKIVYDENGIATLDFWNVFIGGSFPALAAMVIFVFYCIFTKYDPTELFDTSRIKNGEVVRYIFIVLFFQQISYFCSMFIMSFLNSHDLEVAGLNYKIAHDPETYAIDILSAVLLAPIGEELIYRGIVLRCSAKVSGRFAIFLSALIFGLMHGNPYQAVLGFLLGIPLAIITIKTGSIIPAIICHMANNAMASIPTVIEYFDEEMSYIVNIVEIPIFFVIGLIVLITTVLSGGMKFPEYTAHHKKRTLPILITSWSMIVIAIIYVYDIITSIQPIYY